MKSPLSEIRRFQKIAGLLKEGDLDLSDTPKFVDRKKQFYVYDLDGEGEPMGPYSHEEAVRVKDSLNRQDWRRSLGIDSFDIIDGEAADEMWSHLEEDIDLSDTPKFESNLNIYEDIDLSDTPAFGADITSALLKAGVDLDSDVYVLNFHPRSSLLMYGAFPADVVRPTEAIHYLESKIAQLKGVGTEIYFGEYMKGDPVYLRRAGIPSSAKERLSVVFNEDDPEEGDAYTIFQ